MKWWLTLMCLCNALYRFYYCKPIALIALNWWCFVSALGWSFSKLHLRIILLVSMHAVKQLFVYTIFAVMLCSASVLDIMLLGQYRGISVTVHIIIAIYIYIWVAGKGLIINASFAEHDKFNLDEHVWIIIINFTLNLSSKKHLVQRFRDNCY